MPELPISIIILTKNSEKTIRECLDSVVNNSPREIVVVDGYSTDRTLNIAREYTDKIYCDDGRGLTYSRQLGAEMAGEEYIMYVDSAVILLPDTLRNMLNELNSEGYGAMTARYKIIGAHGYIAWAASHYNNNIRNEQPGERKATIPMRATLFPRKLVLKYKFDFSTPNWDDASISQNLLEAGYRLGVSQSHIYFYHPWGRKGRGFFWGGFAIGESFLKYWKSPSLLLKYTLLRGLGSPIHGLLVSLGKREFRLIPYFLFVFFGQIIGFTIRLLNPLIGSLIKLKR